MPDTTPPARSDETLVVVVTGPVGAGKTTTAIALADALIAHKVPNALIDMDYLSWAWPAPVDDRFNSRLGYRNLAFVANTYREHGVRVMVMAGVVEEEQDRARAAAEIPGSRVVIVRLRVPLDLIAERLHGRDSGDDLAWSLNRAPELEGIMDAAGIGTAPGDLIVDVGRRTPAEVAEEIITRLGIEP